MRICSGTNLVTLNYMKFKQAEGIYKETAHEFMRKGRNKTQDRIRLRTAYINAEDIRF